jgi:hypothetical protein
MPISISRGSKIEEHIFNVSPVRAMANRSVIVENVEKRMTLEYLRSRLRAGRFTDTMSRGHPLEMFKIRTESLEKHFYVGFVSQFRLRVGGIITGTRRKPWQTGH